MIFLPLKISKSLLVMASEVLIRYHIISYNITITNLALATLMSNQTPKAPYLLKDPNGIVTIVAAKPTGVTGVGPLGMQMVRGFCDI